MKKTLRIIFLVFFGLLAFRFLLSLINIALLSPLKLEKPRPAWPYTSAVGAIHIHSRHSDGSGTLRAIARAARANHLDFIWLSDHNTLALKDSQNAIQQPLILVGSELSLRPGHLLEYGLQNLYTENRVGGTAGIIDSINAHHGLAFIAHPFHPKIRWKGKIPGGATGIEILNADVEWRNDPPLQVLGTFLAYPLFNQAMNLLIDFPRREVHLWDSLSVHRNTVGIGSVDAHAKIKLSKTSYWKFPSYRRIFAFIQDLVYLRTPLPATPDAARQQIVAGLRRGNLLFGFSGLGDLREVGLWAQSRQTIYFPGDSIRLAPATKLTIHIRLPAHHLFETRLYHRGIQIAASQAREISWPLAQPGPYRVVIFQRRFKLPGFSRKLIPWIFSNNFYVYQHKQPRQLPAKSSG